MNLLITVILSTQVYSYWLFCIQHGIQDNSACYMFGGRPARQEKTDYIFCQKYNYHGFNIHWLLFIFNHQWTSS